MKATFNRPEGFSLPQHPRGKILPPAAPPKGIPAAKPVSRDVYRKQRIESYGITVEEHNELFEAQDGVCAICLREEWVVGRSLAIDHDHATGKVRGLLCGPCNQGLGLLADDIARLQRAIDYLRRANE